MLNLECYCFFSLFYFFLTFSSLSFLDQNGMVYYSSKMMTECNEFMPYCVNMKDLVVAKRIRFFII